MNKRYIKQYLRSKRTNKIGNKSVVLTDNYHIPYHGINNMNTIVISSVGTGKTRGFLKSNLLQKGCSFVITDTKGDLFNEFSLYLQSQTCDEDQPYDIKLVNLKDMCYSHHYNPFKYMQTEEDVLNFAQSVAINVAKNPSDSFWYSTSTNLIASLCFFIFETYLPEKRNLQTLLYLFNNYLKQSTENYYNKYGEQNKYKELIDYLPEDSLAKKFFLKVQCNERTWDSIVVTVGQALSVFEYTKMQELTRNDDLELDQLGCKRMAIFINLDDMNPCYDFIAGLLYTQIFNILYKTADISPRRQLAEHVRFFMDDFANYKIPNISHILSTCRSRGISLAMILQSESQLQAVYGNDALNLIANAAYIYIGSNDLATQTSVASRLGIPVEIVQNNINKTYVFFPEGITIKDTKADYTTHPLYQNLYRYSDRPALFFNNDAMPINFWTPIWEQTVKERQWILNNSDDIILPQQRKDCFDSNEERMFYSQLLRSAEYQNGVFDFDIHKDLRDIFDVNSLTNQSFKYKIMLMHCDFVFFKDDAIIAVLEIDGSQHLLDAKQEENDRLKDKLFANIGIPIIRRTAREVRESCEEVCKDVIAFIVEEKQKTN